MRGTSNRNDRGNTRDRLARRKWLLKNWAADWESWSGDKHYCRCYRCGRLLTLEAMTVDRIVPGYRGGKYTRDNIRPACAKCNSSTGGSTRRKK